MHLAIWAVGKLSRSPEKELIDTYLQRCPVLGQKIGWQGFAVREFNDTAAMAQALPDKAYIIACDERGTSPTSTDLAHMLQQVDASHCVFLIGAADGLGDALRQRAHKMICFGRMTLPHMLLRVVLSEQIYRVCTVLTHHPYHRA